MCVPRGTRRLRGARSGGPAGRGGRALGWGWGSEFQSGEPTGRRPAERARPEPRPARAPSLGRPSSRPAAASPDPAGRVSGCRERAGRPAAGNVSSAAVFSTPCARSCCFQEEELRGTSRGSGAARGARLSSAPSLPALPRLPWLSRSLERLQRSGGREVSGPQRRWTPLQTQSPRPRLLRCHD